MPNRSQLTRPHTGWGWFAAYDRPQHSVAVLHADTTGSTCYFHRPWQVINTTLDAFMIEL